MICFYYGIRVTEFGFGMLTNSLFWAVLLFIAISYTDITAGRGNRAFWLLPLHAIPLGTIAYLYREPLMNRDWLALLPALPDMLVLAEKEKACQQIGLKSNIIRLPEYCSQSQLDDAIAVQAMDDNVVGVMLQLPLPKHLNAESAMEHIPFYKDVDGFDHINTGHLWKNGDPKHIACTPAGIMFALKESGVTFAGKHAVIIGRSNTVGKPLAALLLKEDATVTVCHSKTQNLIVTVTDKELINAYMELFDLI